MNVERHAVCVLFTDLRYLYLFLQTEILNEEKRLISAVDYYFIQEDGFRFKVRVSLIFCRVKGFLVIL